MITGKAEYLITITSLGIGMIISYACFNGLNINSASIPDETIDYAMTAESFQKEYLADSFLADVTYIGKKIKVTGIVTNRTKNEITIGSFFIGSFKNKKTLPKINQPITIIGLCNGYDAKRDKVALIDCSIKP